MLAGEPYGYGGLAIPVDLAGVRPLVGGIKVYMPRFL